MAQFKFKENDCDVHDREKLTRYRENAERWFEWIDGDPEHSISRQLSALMWNDAVFRTLNEARRVEGADKSASRAPLLASFLDAGYVNVQVLGISKLLEKNPPQANKGVISLRRIVDELSANRDLFTREVFIAHDGLPYDFEAIQKAHMEQLLAKHGTEPVFEAMDVEGPQAWDTAQRQHQLFDRLSGVKPEHRSREDRIGDQLFDELCKALEDPIFKDIKDLRHKSLAHAADAASRLQAAHRNGFKLGDAAAAHRILLAMLQAISAGLLYGSWRAAAIPVPQHDIFTHFADPLVQEDQIAKLRAHWDELSKERDSWLKDGYAQFIPSA